MKGDHTWEGFKGHQPHLPPRQTEGQPPHRLFETNQEAVCTGEKGVYWSPNHPSTHLLIHLPTHPSIPPPPPPSPPPSPPLPPPPPRHHPSIHPSFHPPSHENYPAQHPAVVTQAGELSMSGWWGVRQRASGTLEGMKTQEPWQPGLLLRASSPGSDLQPVTILYS